MDHFISRTNLKDPPLFGGPGKQKGISNKNSSSLTSTMPMLQTQKRTSSSEHHQSLHENMFKDEDLELPCPTRDQHQAADRDLDTW